MKIIFVRLGQGIPCDSFQLIQGDKIPSNQKKDIFDVRFEATIQFAQCNAVWIGNIDLQIPKLTNANISFCTSGGQGYETIQWNWLYMDFQFPGQPYYGLMKHTWVNIVTNKIKVNCRARTPQQRQRTSADKDKLGVWRNMLSHMLQNGYDLGVIQGSNLFIIQAPLPNLCSMEIGAQPVDPRAAQFLVAFCQQTQIFFRITNGMQVQFLREMIGK